MAIGMAGLWRLRQAVTSQAVCPSVAALSPGQLTVALWQSGAQCIEGSLHADLGEFVRLLCLPQNASGSRFLERPGATLTAQANQQLAVASSVT